MNSQNKHFRYFISVVYLMAGLTLASENTVPPLTIQEQSKAIQIRKLIFPLGKPIASEAADALSLEDREILLRHLRANIAKMKEYGASDFQVSGSGEALELAELGDNEGRRMVEAEYLINPENGSLRIRQLNDPKTIAAIGEALFKDEPLTMDVGDVGRYGAQVYAYHNVIRLLQSTRAFSKEVSDWARQMDVSKGNFLVNLAILRDWFRVNQTALKTAEFTSVKPGQKPSPGVATPSLVSAEANQSGSVRAPGLNGSIESPHKGSGIGSGLRWIIASIVAALVIFFSFRKRSRGT